MQEVLESGSHGDVIAWPSENTDPIYNVGTVPNYGVT